jgi:hypothetical protein
MVFDLLKIPSDTEEANEVMKQPVTSKKSEESYETDLEMVRTG